MGENKVKFCRAEQFFKGYPFEALKMGNEGYTQDLHYHDYIQVWYVKRGQCNHWFDGVEYKLNQGDIFVLPAYMEHKLIYSASDAPVLLECGFLEEFISGASEYDLLKSFKLPKNKVKPMFSLDGDAIREIEKLFEEILIEYNHKEKFFEQYIRANILKILSIVARKYNKSISMEKNNLIGKHKAVVMKIIDYMTENCTKKIYIEDVCCMAGMSATHFSFVFKNITGRTFTEHMRFIKISKAKELLTENKKSISAIAKELGFDDPAYFDRVFKKEVGMTPAKFKNVQ